MRFSVFRCPLVHKGVMPVMDTMEVLTLLLVVFAALSFIDNHLFYWLTRERAIYSFSVI